MNSLTAPQFMKINLNHTKTHVQVQPVCWYGKGWFRVPLRSVITLQMEQQFPPCSWISGDSDFTTRGTRGYPVNWWCSRFPADTACFCLERGNVLEVFLFISSLKLCLRVGYIACGQSQRERMGSRYCWFYFKVVEFL